LGLEALKETCGQEKLHDITALYLSRRSLDR